MTLIPGRAYRLEGMAPEMWDNSHKDFGRPRALAVLYLGEVHGTRTWHIFEVWIHQRERGALMMTAHDLERLTVTEIHR